MNSVGILYPGGLGSAVGQAIVKAGDSAMTCLLGRSAKTRVRAAPVGFVIAKSLREIAEECNFVISLVPPIHATDVARRFAASCDSAYVDHRLTKGVIYLDGNSVNPISKRQIAEIVSKRGVPCVDCAFFGPANRISQDNVLALSGPCAEQVKPLFEKFIEVRVVGKEIGQASALKMTLAIVTKALPTLFIEMICAAEKNGQLEMNMDLMRRLHPGITSFLERSLPTYPAYVARRVCELKEVMQWQSFLNQRAIMTKGAMSILERLSQNRFDEREAWSFEGLVHYISKTQLLGTS